jgi:hypothetical protein
MNNRIIYSDNGVLKDYSPQFNSYHSDSVDLTLKTTDYLYIGSRLPFNHIYLKLDENDSNDLALNVEYWDGNIWREVVELIDETEGLKKSGHIQFTPNRRYTWAWEPTNEDGSQITGLTDVVIYDLYWMRISVSTESEETSFNWIGNVFCEDEDIYPEFPSLEKANTKQAYKVGKLNWEEQRVRASQVLINDLIAKNVIQEKGQILDWRLFTNACVSKTAEIIFSAFGDDYTDNRDAARGEYKLRLSNMNYRVDQNKNAIEDKYEQGFKSGFLSR